MKFFFAFLLVGSILCAVNFFILYFLRTRISRRETYPEKEIDTSAALKPRPSGRGQKAPLSINLEQTPGFSPGFVEWVDFSDTKLNFDQELGEFRSIIKESLDEVRKERISLEETKENFTRLIEESKHYIQRLEELKKEMLSPAPKDIPRRVSCGQGGGESRNTYYEAINSLLGRGLSIENVAQRLQMGVGEVRLRLALLEKADTRYEDR